MKKIWQQGHLQGSGLQSLNIFLVQYLRKMHFAYVLWLGFALGLHRFYLWDNKMAWFYITVTMLSLILFFISNDYLSLWLLSINVALSIYDLFWMPKRIVQLNKEIRMQAYLQHGAKPDENYKGRYNEDNKEYLQHYVLEKETEKAGIQPVSQTTQTQKPILSFSEQEKLLKEALKSKKTK